MLSECLFGPAGPRHGFDFTELGRHLNFLHVILQRLIELLMSARVGSILEMSVPFMFLDMLPGEPFHTAYPLCYAVGLICYRDP